MKIPLTHIRFLERAEIQFRKKTAVIDGDQRWTYAEYASRCRQMANMLESLKLSPGGRVACLSYNTHHLLEAYYGVNLAGGIIVPLNVRLCPSEYKFILNDCKAEVVLFHQDFSPLLEDIANHLESVRYFILLDKADPPRWAFPDSIENMLEKEEQKYNFDVMQQNEDAVASIFYSSGTTGHPKGVMLTHRNLYLHALEVGLMTKASESDVVLHIIPLFHVNGWGSPQYFTCLGATHVLIRDFEVEAIFTKIQQYKVTTFSLVPTMAESLINHRSLSHFNFTSVRLVKIGGAPSTPGLIRAVTEVFDCDCFAGYGLTETAPVLTMATPKVYLDLTHEQEFILKSKAGYPIPGVHLNLIDSDGNSLPWNGRTIGELLIRSDGAMAGYWNHREATRAIFEGGWLHTGDLATIDSDGCVHIVDRKKDIIISGGENISSVEIEREILSHPKILECVVVAVPDSRWGEVPKALVILKPGVSLSAEEIIDYSRKKLASFKVPKSIEFHESFPKGGTGKILKKDLRQKYW